MTKYVINSGGLKSNPVKAKNFFSEILDGFGTSPHVLLCFFANPREVWEDKFDNYSQGFLDWTPKGVDPTFELAFPDKFAEQIQNADVISIHGGDDHLLQYWLKQFKIPSIWDGKVVATNSASSDALSTHFWTCDWRLCMDGLGILPIKFIPHYTSDFGSGGSRGTVNWDNAYKELEEYGDKSLPIHALEEGDYIVIEQ